MLKPKIAQWQRRCGRVGARTSETMIHHPGSHNSLQYSDTLPLQQSFTPLLPALQEQIKMNIGTNTNLYAECSLSRK